MLQFPPMGSSSGKTRSGQEVRLEFGSTPAWGNAQFFAVDSKLAISLYGLVPHSINRLRLCEGNREIHSLNPVVAHESGEGTSTTTLDKITSIPESWYVLLEA